MLKVNKSYYWVVVVLMAVFVMSMTQQESRETKQLNKKIDKGIDLGDELFNVNNFQAALEEYMKVYALNPDHAELNLKIGLCYLYGSPKSECLEYFKKAYNVESFYERMINFYVGRGYQLNNEFEKAISYYSKHKLIEDKIPQNEYISIEKRISECEYGVQLIKLPSSIKIENLGNQINSSSSDFRPVVTGNGKNLYFTSLQNVQSQGKTLTTDEKPNEDIFRAVNFNGSWSKAENLGAPVNSAVNDAVSGISWDGKSMVLFNNDMQGDLYLTENRNGKWSAPERFPPTINSKFIESTSAFSPNKDTLYFVSDRSDLTVGMKDIYMSVKLTDGRWAAATNLGNGINTPYNEEAICLDPSGKLLFFSSEGHNSVGGYDVFVSHKLKNGTWSKPVNLGFPLNTADDDLFFTITENENIAYYSAIRKEGFGKEDIYKISFRPKELFAEKKMVEKPKEKTETVVIKPVTTDSLPIKVVKEEIVVKIPEKFEEKLKEKSISEIYAGLKEKEIVELVFETEKLDEAYTDQKVVLEKAREITNKLLQNNTIAIDVLKQNPTKVVIEIVNTSSSKGMDFTYPSGGKGTFIVMMPQPEYDVNMDIEDISVTIGKSVLVSSDIQRELVSNNIIAVDVE